MKTLILSLLAFILSATAQTCSMPSESSTTETQEIIISTQDTNKLKEKPTVREISYRVSDWGPGQVVIKEVTINGHKYIVGTIIAGSSEGGSSITIIPSLSENEE